MANLPPYTLTYDEKKKDWPLKNDLTGQTKRRFDTKEEATQRGALKQAVGPDGGSVKIQKQDGRYQEERTFPRGRDPRRSPG